MTSKTKSILAPLLFLLLAAPAFARTPTTTGTEASRQTSTQAAAKTGSIHGVVTDESGGFVAGAKITLANASGPVADATSDKDGAYSFANLQPGTYTVEASAPQLILPQPIRVDVKSAATQTINLKLKVAPTEQQIHVDENAGPTVSTEAAGNASALVLRGADLDTLSDDPEDLATDLQALAGPSAGPSGGQMYIDGFSGGQLPSKDSIREIRINQNPFSPEYDKLGYGRIEVFTKPGGPHFHGNAHYNFGDSFWNSRNPYAAEKAPFRLDEYGGSLESPINSKASFFMVVDGAAIDNGAIINGTTLDPTTLAIINPYTQVFTIPQRRIRLSPRVDYQLRPSDTLSVRYAFEHADIQHSGVGSFSLVPTGVHNHGNESTLQLSNTMILGSNAINETRFQFDRATISNIADNLNPQIDVLNSFISGGAQVGASSNTIDSFEFQNYTTISRQAHTWRFGVRVRAATLGNTSPINFGGTFTFGGRLAPELNSNNQPVLDSSGNPILINIDSIESYRRTLLFQQMGDTAAQIRALGGGASQFSINGGTPSASIDQEDIGAFLGDDWRVRRNLTLNLGVRYEGQTNIHDWLDFAPRVGLAWAPAGGHAGANPKTVLRAGFGMFYQRFDIASVLAAERFNGVVQQQYVVTSPDFFPSVPAISSLPAASQQATEKLASDLHAPYLMESALGIEHQLPAHTTIAVTYVNSHGARQFLTNDINAPLPGTYNPQVPGSGTYPLGNPNPVFLVQSAGRYNQNEVITNVNSRVSNSISLFGSYTYNRALSNTDYSPPPQNTDFNPAIGYSGVGVGTLPANPYSMVGEYGPASTDIHNQGTFGGSVRIPWGFLFSPLIVVDSGAPFNISVGQDLYGDTLFNGRPGIATDTTRPGLVSTAYGLLDPNPIPGEVIIGRNFGRGPGIVLANLRIAKIFSFGPAAEGTASVGGRRPDQGPFGGGGGSNTASTNHLYNLTVSMSIRNIINHNNPGPVIGNVASPQFGLANQPYGSGGLGGTGFSESADNRRLELQFRFSF